MRELDAVDSRTTSRHSLHPHFNTTIMVKKILEFITIMWIFFSIILLVFFCFDENITGLWTLAAINALLLLIPTKRKS